MVVIEFFACNHSILNEVLNSLYFLCDPTHLLKALEIIDRQKKSEHLCLKTPILINSDSKLF